MKIGSTHLRVEIAWIRVIVIHIRCYSFFGYAAEWRVQSYTRRRACRCCPSNLTLGVAVVLRSAHNPTTIHFTFRSTHNAFAFRSHNASLFPYQCVLMCLCVRATICATFSTCKMVHNLVTFNSEYGDPNRLFLACCIFSRTPTGPCAVIPANTNTERDGPTSYAATYNTYVSVP